MGLKEIFRAAHWLLFLAAALCSAMLFAPLSYSANFRTNVYGEIYGSWAVVERTLETGPSRIETTHFYQDGFIFAYVVITSVAALLLFWVLFFGKDNVRRTKRLVYVNALLFLQVTWALALYFHAADFVGEVQEEHLESGFQREFMLHFFILIFTWAAKRRYRKAAEAEFAAQASNG